MPQFTDSFFEDSVNEEILSVMSDDDSIPDSLKWFSGNISSYYKSNINIAHLNINSTQNKLDEVKEMLNRNMFDILFIGKTELNGSYSSSLLYHPGYRIVRRDRKKGAGGLMAFIREDLSAYRRRKLEPESVEEICLDVTDFRKCRFIVCTCYRSEKVNKPAEFISSLSSAIELMFKCCQEIILIGDYNLDMLVNKMKEQGKTKHSRICATAASDGAQMSVDEFTDHPSIKRIAEHFGPASNFDFQLIEAEYVKDILLKLNSRKAVGCDNISQRLLRITTSAIAQQLTCLINYLITSCSWPMVWKCSNVSPIYDNVELTDSLKILGVILDERITFKPYIQVQLKKACAETAAMRKLRKFIPQDVMIRLYKAYVLPHLEYCSPLQLGLSNGLKNKLEDTNCYILRTILGEMGTKGGGAKFNCKAQAKKKKQHKERVTVTVSLEGVRIEDDTTWAMVHMHPVKRISFVYPDPDEKKIFGYVCGQPNHSTGYNFYALKSENAQTTIDAIIEIFDMTANFRYGAELAEKQFPKIHQMFIGATNDDQTPLFVTEFMETSLRALSQQRYLSQEEISVTALDVARGLNHLHQKQPIPILHRDISWENVLLWRKDDQWRTKVSDYGTANLSNRA
ncbi:Protein disabled [Stylophora pistillata]|uniref:Protein disabled n=1 Tax=Stylophora pistillata TaxID=50429 RepID=A0A2B4RAJ6_STYPI|nr:Protein disabled [Stylophora pistillata]